MRFAAILAATALTLPLAHTASAGTAGVERPTLLAQAGQPDWPPNIGPRRGNGEGEKKREQNRERPKLGQPGPPPQKAPQPQANKPQRPPQGPGPMQPAPPAPRAERPQQPPKQAPQRQAEPPRKSAPQPAPKRAEPARPERPAAAPPRGEGPSRQADPRREKAGPGAEFLHRQKEQANERRKRPAEAPAKAPVPPKPEATPPKRNVQQRPEAEPRGEAAASQTPQLGIAGEREDPRVRELRQKLHQQRREAVRQADRPDRDEARRRGRDGRERPVEDDRRDRRGPPRGAAGFMLPFASGDIVQDSGDRVIVRRNGQLLIRSDSETDRLLRRARDVSVDELGGGRTRTIVTRPDGIRVITERDYDGEIIRRVRQYPDGNQVVLIDERGYDRRDREYEPGYFERSLPPLDLQMPQDRYIVEMQRASERELEDALMAPPVEGVERIYTLEEVRDSSRLRDKLRRVDLDAITFDTGSAAISRSQIGELSAIGQAIEDVLSRNPNEIFLVEGHTDAVGSDVSNLALSDRRAESVAIVLSENFDIPPENLVTQGYGEQYLKVPTETAERSNRRVAVRRITPLIQSTSR
ncbi:hypothetical protein CKO32_14950 [Afifella marina DSM 2698]|nr:hypothetical protein [Afifella marina DSM 2698]MBK1628453.1 hypothetical protein [Afifella marina]MBK5917940.1 hypothetical protein [Afifella marina]RAI18723.1 hypothetical protein CH311_14710 [Afifella marina DSM 2698]